METFDEWWSRSGKFIDLDTENVSWYDKRKGLAQSAFIAAIAQSGNYVVDDSIFPRRAQFGNGRVVVIREREDDPGRFYLGIGSARD
jgi:hypothetical protein